MTPTAGRIVHFFPGDYHRENEFKDILNGAELLPAIVTQAFGEDMANISVFTPFSGIISLGSVYSRNHPSYVEGYSYWDWPAKA